VPLRAAIKLFTSEHFWRDHSRVYASHGFTVCLSLNLCVLKPSFFGGSRAENRGMLEVSFWCTLAYG